MNSYISLVLVLGIILGVWFARRNKKLPELMERQAREKAENLAVIVEAMESRGKITNNDVEKLTGVSDATATRYLEELVKERKIIKNGTEGKYVYYEKAR